jgi:hypothetical protein
MVQDDVEALVAVERADVIGATDRVSLPVPAGSPGMFPDLSLAGSGRTFQVLVEIKVDAELHTIVVDGEPLQQPDAYLEAWRRFSDPGAEADVRRVGTLTRAGVKRPRPDSWRVRDLLWSELSETFDGLRRDDAVEDHVRVVLGEFLQLIQERVLVTQVEMADELRSLARALVPKVSAELVARLGGGRVRSLNERGDYVGQYVTLTEPGVGEPITLWVYVSAAGGRYNAPGAPDRLWVSEYAPDEKLPGAVRDALAKSGSMELLRDRVGFVRYAMCWGLEQLDAPPPERVATDVGRVLAEVTSRLQTSG